MNKIYRVDISELSPQEKKEVMEKLRGWCFMVTERRDANRTLIALDAYWDLNGDFFEFFQLPEKCPVRDVTHWDLTQ